jgi:riboflavin synthase
MFTGIVEEVGRVVRAEPVGGNLRLTVAAAKVLEDLAVGDSIAVSGCCLTAVEIDRESFTVELSQESVAKTAPRWRVWGKVNLERAMSAQGRFGGHIVSGHVEGVGEVLGVRAEPGAHVVRLRAPTHIARYLIPKGSITVDGVSLTVVEVGGPGGTRADWPSEVFSLWIIPHTLLVTTLGELGPGAKVNLEADLIAKYLERLALFPPQKEQQREQEERHVPQASQAR